MFYNVQDSYDTISDMIEPEDRWDCFGHVLYEVEENKIIVMQYTGLKDKNGKEIYEGDIIRIKSWTRGFKCPKCGYEESRDFIGKVTWKNCIVGDDNNYSVAGYYITKGLNEIRIDFNIEEMDDIEVIGNIYENKELLEDNMK